MKSFKQHILEAGPLEKGLGTLLNIGKGDLARRILLGPKKKRDKVSKEGEEDERPVHTVGRRVATRAAKGWLANKIMQSLTNKPAPEEDEDEVSELSHEEKRNRAEKAKAQRDAVHGAAK